MTTGLPSSYNELVAVRRSGGIGRRTGLKIPGRQRRAGSSPAFGTTSEQSTLCSVFLLQRKTSARSLAPPLPQKLTAVLSRKNIRSSLARFCLSTFCGITRLRRVRMAKCQFNFGRLLHVAMDFAIIISSSLLVPQKKHACFASALINARIAALLYCRFLAARLYDKNVSSNFGRSTYSK